MVLLVAFSAIFLLLGGATVTVLLVMFKDKVLAPPEEGIIDAAMYAQTVQRMQSIAGSMAVRGRDGTYPELYELVRGGLPPMMTRDKWGTTFRCENGIVTSAGKDTKFDTDDDIWFDMSTGELDGYMPDIDAIVQDASIIPDGAKEAYLTAKRLQEQNYQRQMEAQRRIQMIESGEYRGAIMDDSWGDFRPRSADDSFDPYGYDAGNYYPERGAQNSYDDSWSSYDDNFAATDYGTDDSTYDDSYDDYGTDDYGTDDDYYDDSSDVEDYEY